MPPVNTEIPGGSAKLYTAHIEIDGTGDFLAKHILQEGFAEKFYECRAVSNLIEKNVSLASTTLPTI